MIRSGAGLDLLQAYQHGEFCLCTDPNEAPDRTDTCLAIRRDLEERIEAIEAEITRSLEMFYEPIYRGMVESADHRLVAELLRLSTGGKP